MIGDVLEYLRWRLETDGVISTTVSLYGEGDERSPAIAYQVAPKDMLMPYIVVNANLGADSNPSLDRFIYAVDIYTDNGDFSTAQVLTDRVQFLLDKLRLPPDIGVGVWRDSRYIIPNEEEPAVQHHYVSFIVRHNRIY